ncbi:hypothetical protein ACF07Y_39820 [Streptomyces sp. NPDC016566]|uniref:hypothetical protein n=1 Tax=Streptomyces sp. NPDC016566 TaxID=3364967 RepID=UPI0036F9E076
MDLDTVADELYGLRPEEFVAARDRYAAQARTSGEQELAKEITALRRPSLAAWAGNLLVRRLPGEVQPLLVLGEELRRAHRELDGPQLRLLARRQRELTGALAGQARRLAAEAGHPVGEGVRREVEETLHAVLADPEAAREWAAGRLVKPLRAAIGFPEADEAAAGRRALPTPEPGPKAVRHGGGEERRRQLAGARTAARDAERELRALQEEAAAAEADAEEAARRSAQAEKRLRELREEARSVQAEQGRARADEQDARERARKAGRHVREAGRRARTAAARVERLAENTESWESYGTGPNSPRAEASSPSTRTARADPGERRERSLLRVHQVRPSVAYRGLRRSAEV